MEKLIVKFVCLSGSENLDKLYDSYRELGMNGTGEKLYKQAKSLLTVKN